ncbi:MAG: SDR family NAD(P)-dependent oxidoreductase [Lachnospiraceae bacterium]|nr:SDR family NAD(P)-dependent oxidoreductase [Lachnospiraceae bacterium]
MRIALITGASSGMGSEFARCIDRTEKEIDAIWLVARRRERLEEVARQLAHPAKVIPMDLTKAESADALEDLLRGSEADNRMETACSGTGFCGGTVQVGIFVNCAGYAKIGNYEKVSRYDSNQMIDLNCKAAVNTTLAVLPYMRAGDRILELCSTSSFQPVPHLNIYAAGKAFLYSYSRALRMELLPRGIMVTAVCPWWVADTEFLPTAMDNAANPDYEKSIRGFLLPSRKDRVVRRALQASRMGFAVSTPGIMCFLHRLFSKLIPRTGMLYLWEIMRRLG